MYSYYLDKDELFLIVFTDSDGGENLTTNESIS